MNATITQPCPPHDYSAYAPTVGYFECSKCRDRIDHSDVRFAALLVEREKLSSENGQEVSASRYAQPCDSHEYITTGCPDCGKLA